MPKKTNFCIYSFVHSRISITIFVLWTAVINKKNIEKKMLSFFFFTVCSKKVYLDWKIFGKMESLDQFFVLQNLS